MWVLLLLVAGLGGLLSLATNPVSAETPTEVADGLVEGVYVAPGRGGDIDPAIMANAISEAAKDGYAMIVVLPSDPQPTAEAFALRARQAADADIALLFGPEGEVEASIISDLDEGEVQAIALARAASSPGQAADAYVKRILIQPEIPQPAIIGQIVTGVFYMLLALGAVIFAELALRKFKDRRIRI